MEILGARYRKQTLVERTEKTLGAHFRTFTTHDRVRKFGARLSITNARQTW